MVSVDVKHHVYLLDELLLRDPASGSLRKYDEAMFGVQKASLDMLWDYSPSSANIASDWLRAKRALLQTRKKRLERQIKMDDCVDISLASEEVELFVELWEAQPCLWDP